MPSLLEGEISREEHEAAIGAAHSAGVTEGRREGETIGAAAAYARIGAIMRSDKIRGREALAADLACQSPHMSVEQVVAFIERVPAPAASSVPSIQSRVEATGVNAVESGAATSTPSGNPGAEDRARELNEMRARAGKEAASTVNASRGYGRRPAA